MMKAVVHGLGIGSNGFAGALGAWSDESGAPPASQRWVLQRRPPIW